MTLMINNLACLVSVPNHHWTGDPMTTDRSCCVPFPPQNYECANNNFYGFALARITFPYLSVSPPITRRGPSGPRRDHIIVVYKGMIHARKVCLSIFCLRKKAITVCQHCSPPSWERDCAEIDIGLRKTLWDGSAWLRNQRFGYVDWAEIFVNIAQYTGTPGWINMEKRLDRWTILVLLNNFEI